MFNLSIYPSLPETLHHFVVLVSSLSITIVCTTNVRLWFYNRLFSTPPPAWKLFSVRPSVRGFRRLVTGFLNPVRLVINYVELYLFVFWAVVTRDHPRSRARSNNYANCSYSVRTQLLGFTNKIRVESRHRNVAGLTREQNIYVYTHICNTWNYKEVIARTVPRMTRGNTTTQKHLWCK